MTCDDGALQRGRFARGAPAQRQVGLSQLRQPGDCNGGQVDTTAGPNRAACGPRAGAGEGGIEGGSQDFETLPRFPKSEAATLAL
jgi:hypothetical protein